MEYDHWSVQHPPAFCIDYLHWKMNAELFRSRCYPASVESNRIVPPKLDFINTIFFLFLHPPLSSSSPPVLKELNQWIRSLALDATGINSGSAPSWNRQKRPALHCSPFSLLVSPSSWKGPQHPIRLASNPTASDSVRIRREDVISSYGAILPSSSRSHTTGTVLKNTHT